MGDTLRMSQRWRNKSLAVLLKSYHVHWQFFSQRKMFDEGARERGEETKAANDLQLGRGLGWTLGGGNWCLPNKQNQFQIHKNALQMFMEVVTSLRVRKRELYIHFKCFKDDKSWLSRLAGEAGQSDKSEIQCSSMILILSICLALFVR